MGLRVGIAGFGSIGTVHARIFDSLPETAAIQVADPNRTNESRFAALAKGDAFREHYEAMDGCDCVVIALPTEHHAAAVSHFASAGTPMLIEKPLGLSLAEAQGIAATIEREGVPAMVGLTGLYHPEFHAMYQRLGAIGELVSVTERLHQAGPGLGHYLDDERGVLLLNGIHTLHRLHRIAAVKKAEECLAVDDVVLSHEAFGMRGEDLAKGRLRLGAAPFVFEISFRDDAQCDNGWPVDYGIEVAGTRGSIIVTGLESCETHCADGAVEVVYRHPDGPLRGRSQYGRIIPGLTAEIEAFVRFLASGETRHHTLDGALAGQALVEECYEKASEPGQPDGTP